MKKKLTTAALTCVLALGGVCPAVSRGDDALRNGGISEPAAAYTGVVTLRASSDSPLVAALPRSNVANKEVVATVSRYINAAKNEYSPQYGSQTVAIREQIVQKLRDYSDYVAQSGAEDERAFVAELHLDNLIKLAEESPTLFQTRLASAVEAFSNYVDSSRKNVERERSLVVSMNYYLATISAASAAAEGPAKKGERIPQPAEPLPLDPSVPVPEDAPEPEETDEELELEKQECFNYYCDELERAVRLYFAGEGENSLDDIVSAIGEMRYYQSESPSVIRLANFLQGILSGKNFYLEASERFLSAFTYREVSEDFNVNENIRGTLAKGNGVLRGHTAIEMIPNTTRAEMRITLNGNVSTRTVGENRGVFIHTDNAGAVAATKPIFLNATGLITTSAAVANANVKSTVRGIDTNRMTLFGGKIINNKVYQELPASERDSAEKVKARVCSELDYQANAQILEMNRRVEKMEIDSPVSMIRKLVSSTSDDRLYISCVLGRNLQFSVPEPALEESLNEMRRKLVGNQVDGYLVAETSESKTQQLLDGSRLRSLRSNGGLAALAPNLHNNPVTAVTSRSSLPRLEPFKNIALNAEKKRSSNSDSDLVIRFHQTAPNNAAGIALSGVVFGPGYDTLDNVLFRFPGVDPWDIKKILEPYEPKETRPLDPEDNIQDVFVRFDEVQPFATHFDNDKISSFLRLSSCTVDGKEWGPIEIRMVYRLERRGDSFVFVRDELEVLPTGYQDGDAISARFYTFRRIFVKRLEQTINEEYVVAPIPVETIAAYERRGALVPRKLSVDNGWFKIEYQLTSNYDAEEPETDIASSLLKLQKK